MTGTTAPADGEQRPKPKPSRRRARCDGRCGSCFYCKDDLDGQYDHEHDHYPVPYRHGGEDWVAACRPCHMLKDRAHIGILSSGPFLTAVELGMENLPSIQVAGARVAFPLVILREEFAPADDLDVMTAGEALELAGRMDGWVRDCTTTEARVWLARHYGRLLDLRHGTTEEEPMASDALVVHSPAVAGCDRG